MRENWMLFPGELSAEECSQISETLSHLPSEVASTHGGLNTAHRRCNVRWVYNQPLLVQRLLRYVNLANAETFNVDIQQEMEEIQFGEYLASEGGKYDWHHDVYHSNPKNHDRKLSVVVQLSPPDQYEGGNFEFYEVDTPDPEEFKKQGSILIFPSYLVHRVTEITEGTRRSLVSWVRGPRWR